MSADSMPILPETDPASNRWAIQDSNGKYVQDVSSEVMFESIRISKCLVNESTDSRCGEKRALKMKIVLAEKKEKSGISPSVNRVHEDDEDTDIVEDESDSSSELTIVDDAKIEEAPPEQEQIRKKSAKDGRKKRKAKDIQETKSHAVKKRREEREAEKRRSEEISKNRENEAIAKRIAMEFSNFRRFRQPTFGESTTRTGNDSQSETRTSRSDVPPPKPSSPASPAKGDSVQLKNSLEKSPMRLMDVRVTIPSSENLSITMRNGSSLGLSSQCDVSCFELSKSERKDNFPVSSVPSTQGKHHIPIGLPPAPSTVHSASSASQMTTGAAKRESPRQSPHGSPERALVMPDHNRSKVTTIDLANSPEPPSTIVCSAPSYCPGSPPPTIHIPEPLPIIEKVSPKLNESSLSEQNTVQNRRSPQAHVSNQADLNIAARTSPSSSYEPPAPLTVEVPLVSNFPSASNRSQPSQTSHSRAPAQNQFGKLLPNSEANQSADRQTKHKTIDLEKTRGQVFNPKFSAFSVDNLTKIDIRSRETRKSPPIDHHKEAQGKDRDPTDSLSVLARVEQAPIRAEEERRISKEKVRVVRQNEFEFARPHAAPRKSRLKTSSPPPLSSSSAVPPLCPAPPPGSPDVQTTESKSALIWRYIQHQSGGNSMQTIDSALESVRASSNTFKRDESNTILCNYLQGQRKDQSPDKIATRAEQRSPGCATSPEPMVRACDPRPLYLTELKKMLVTLQKFSTTISMDVGKSVYHNIYALVSGGCGVEDFVAKTQRATRLALKPYVGPFLTSYLPLLQKEITVKAASLRMTSSRYMRSNPECIIDPMVEPGDPHEVFISEFDVPNKKKTLPQALSGQNLMVAQATARNPTVDHFSNARVPSDAHDFETRYRPRLTIQNDLMVIQEMLDHISRMVENTKRALSCLQEESSSSVCQETSSQVPLCCPQTASAHFSPASSSSDPRESMISSARLGNTSKSPPPYSSVVNFSACNSQQKTSYLLQSAMLTTRSPSNDYPRPSNAAVNGLNQTQKNLMIETRNPQVTHAALPPAADSPPFAMRSSLVGSPNAMQKETALSSNSNPPMPVPAMEFASPDILAPRNDSLPKEFNGAAGTSTRDNIAVNSNSRGSTFLSSSSAADKKNQDSVRQKSSTAAPKSTGNLRSMPPSTNIGDPECCWNCGRTAQETCSGCKLAKYCGLFCQHRDWEIHHRVCRVIGSNSQKSPSPK